MAELYLTFVSIHSHVTEETVTLEIISGGKKKTVKAVLGDREKAGTETVATGSDMKSEKTTVWEGVEMEATPSGALVTEIRNGSAMTGHLMRGDRISSVNGIRISSPETLKKAFRAANINEGVLFDVTRDGKPTYVSVQSAR